MSEKEYILLPGINSPADLKKLKVDELPLYCDELRRYIILKAMCSECRKNSVIMAQFAIEIVIGLIVAPNTEPVIGCLIKTTKELAPSV